MSPCCSPMRSNMHPGHWKAPGMAVLPAAEDAMGSAIRSGPLKHLCPGPLHQEWWAPSPLAITPSITMCATCWGSFMLKETLHGHSPCIFQNNSKMLLPWLQRFTVGKDLQMSLVLDTQIKASVFQLSWAMKPCSASHIQRDLWCFMCFKIFWGFLGGQPPQNPKI